MNLNNIEPESMKEIHNIRIKHYEERKNLLPEDKIKLINKRAKEIIEKFEIKTREYSKL